MITVTAIAVICAYIIKGMCGFANTLIFSTIMSFTTSNINISPIDLIIGYPSNIYIAWKERKGISMQIFLPLTVMVVIGMIPGVLLLSKGDVRFIKILFGVVITLIAIEMFFRERQKRRKKPSKILLFLIGVISGLLCGLFGIGALLAAYAGRTTQNQNQFKGNLCIVFAIENTIRIVLYILTGILNLVILKKAVLLLPFMVIGLVVGIFLSNKSSEKFIKNAVIILLIFSGVSLILNNIHF